jgi:light-regulated signal transduction histidine kinase (bacteriophytochrome)
MGHGRDLFGRRKNGQEVPLEIGLNTIDTAGGVLTLALIVDLTERKRIETELRQQAEELRRSNQDLEAFAYAASHDLQEPLRAIAGPLQLLQRRFSGQLDPQAEEYIAHSVSGAKRMQQLIDDLLTYARVDRRNSDEAPRSSAAAALLRALANLERAIADSQAEITRGALPVVAADEAQLVMVFQNLLGNAIKFRGPEPLRIQVSAERQGALWRFAVRDNGIGIDPEHFERIFGLFQRLHTRRAYPGTGIGLALCKRIVERHGGQIWVESVAGQGSTFCFTLPAGASEGEAAG